MVTAKAERRNKNRVVLTEADQAFINKVRQSFDDHSGAGDKMHLTQMKKLLGVTDPVIARRVLAVLGGNRSGLTRTEFQSAVIGLVLGREDDKLKFVFDLHDQNGDGVISRPDLTKMLQASLRHNRKSLTPVERRELVRVIFERADKNGDRRISFGEFKSLFAGHQDIRDDLISSVSIWFGATQAGERKEFHFRSIIRFIFGVAPYALARNVLLLAYVGANIYLFYEAVTRYSALGANIYVQVARGCGACLNLNGALILVPMMRTWLTWIRRSFLRVFLPVDKSVAIHKLIGHVMFVFALVHSAAHLMNYTTLDVPVLDSLLRTDAGLTGLILMGVFLIMWVAALGWIRRTRLFELFFVTHMLYIGWFALAIMHGPRFWKFAVFALAGYGVEVLLKMFSRRSASFIEKGTSLPSAVTRLKLHRPEAFSYQPGDYLFLKIPDVSRFEWHPFTISSHPGDGDQIEVHIRRLGNWTSAVYDRFSNARKTPRLPVLIHGPYGTPSSRIFRSQVAILVGAGIGVTPFASILRTVLHRWKRDRKGMRLKKVYFFWLNRGRRSFQWFGELLAELEKEGLSRFLELNIYMTDVKINATNGFVELGLRLLGKKRKKDLTTGLKTITKMGRPRWNEVFARISKEHGVGGVNVFFCGPHALAQAVKPAARRYGFRFRREEF